MDLTPSAIRRKTFELVRRGFDPQEVGAYLENLAEVVAQQQQSLTEAESTVANMEAELKDARSAEEAVRLTMVAATQAKEEMLSSAESEAEALRAKSTAEAEALLAEARSDAETMVAEAERRAAAALDEARNEAVALLERSRAEAEELLTAARSEHAVLTSQADQLRGVIHRSRSTLSSLIEGALGELSGVDAMLADGMNAPKVDVELAPTVRESLDTPTPEQSAPPGIPAPPPLEVIRSESASTDEATTLDVVAEIEPLLRAAREADGDGAVVQLPDAVDRLLNQLRDINR